MATPATALTGTVGDTIVVRSVQRDAYGGASNTPVVWSSSSATVAAVGKIYNSNNGVITCLTAGTATITATMGTVTATFALTVNAVASYDGYVLQVQSDQGFQPVNKTIQTKV